MTSFSPREIAGDICVYTNHSLVIETLET